jgi:glycosyltransferase involved in cell wall biosynthesis
MRGPNGPRRHDDAVPNVRLVHVTTVPVSLNFMRGQVGYMMRRGFAISAISSPGEELALFAQREHAPVYAVPMPRRITPFRDLRAVWAVYRALRRVRPHIVHAHTPKGGLLGTTGAWLARTPVRIYHIRGLPFMTASGARRVLLRWTERVSCALADRVLCVSESVRDVAIAEGVCAADKITVLGGGSGNGVDAAHRFDPDRWAPLRLVRRHALRVPPHAVVVGYVGRIVREKGIIELAAAWQALRTAHPDAYLVIAGDFEPQDPVPDDVALLLRRDERIRIVAWDREMPSLYSAMDMVVLPSYREGFPNVPLEAGAMRIPVVATRIPGCTDAVADGVTGTLVPPRDVDALARAIHEYVVHPQLRQAHGRAGRDRVLREFRQERIWEALHGEYLRLLTRKGIATPVVPGWTEPDAGREEVTDWYDHARGSSAAVRVVQLGGDVSTPPPP